MHKVVVPLMLTLLTLVASGAESWPDWRGPQQNGAVTGKGYPIQWGEEDNIAWKVNLPGWGTSTPVIWGPRIVVTCEVEEKNALVGLNRDGQQLWQVTFGPMASARNRKASGANPSPVTDGNYVYAYYKSGDLACVDFDGRIIWQTNLQEEYGQDQMNWDLGTSPVLTKDSVVVAVMQMSPGSSYLVALDKGTGRVRWKQSRDLGAPAESKDSYSTPLVIEKDGRQMLLVLGADHVTAHLAQSGEEVWRVGGLNPENRRNFRSIASPVLANDTIVAPYARGATLTGIRMNGPTEARVAWTLYGPSADVPSPAVQGSRVYVCGDRGEVTCIDAQAGEELWTERLPRHRYPFSSSPIIAEGRLYATREDGTTFVLQLGDNPKLLATNVLRENTYATPALVDGQIYLRTSDYLFCIGKQ